MGALLAFAALLSGACSESGVSGPEAMVIATSEIEDLALFGPGERIELRLDPERFGPVPLGEGTLVGSLTPRRASASFDIMPGRHRLLFQAETLEGSVPAYSASILFEAHSDGAIIEVRARRDGSLCLPGSTGETACD